MHKTGTSLLVVFLVLFPALTPHAALPNTTGYRHNQAVLLARQGHLKQAVLQLEKLHAHNPLNDSITNDLIVSYSWAGRYGEAETLFERKKPDAYPEYVRYAMVNAYRGLRKPETGLQLLQGLLQHHPGNIAWQLRKALLLIDIKDPDQAEIILSSLTDKAANMRDFQLTSAYLHESKKNWLAALGDYENGLAFLPKDTLLRRKEILGLNQLRAPDAALNHTDKHLQLLKKTELARLLTGRAAQLLRWSTDAQEDFRETRLFCLKALALQLEALALLTDAPKAQNQQRQIYLDMLISLRNLRRMDNLQTLYAMLAEKGPMPDYAQQALADSLLACHKPDQARVIYKTLVDKNSKNYQASRGLFYAYVEEEDFSHAYALIDSMAKHEPRYLSFWDSKTRYPNEQYMDLQVTAAQARFYGDQLKKAYHSLDTFVNRAPANNWLHEIRGQIANARDWPRQGLDDFQLATLLAPKSLDAWAGKGASLIQLHRFKEARPILQDLQNRHPLEHTTSNLSRQWRFARKPTYWGDIVFSHSSGPDLNGDGILASTEIISVPIDDSWYLSAAYRYAWNEIIEGEETFQRSSAGLEYRRGDWDLLGHLTYNDSTRDEPGGNLKAVWQPDDHWRIMLAGERFAVSTPLRALHHDIRSDSLSTALAYRTSEQRDISMSMQLSDFTDDNTRVEAGVRLRQRLIDIPHLDIDGRIDLYGSTNSKTDVPYYSPEHDFSLQGAIHVDHVYHRHYEHLLAQQLDVGYGFYDQKGFASRWIGHIRYEHRYRFTPWMEMLAGFEFGQNVYDGHAEPYRLFRFMINGKF
jgi:biofilm PGA synthesis protein PgaA